MRLPFGYPRRVIGAELMDAAPPAEAALALRDLRRLNRWWGGHATLSLALREVVAPGELFTLIDIGAASGDAAAWVCRVYPRACVISLDQHLSHLQNARGLRVGADAFHLPFGDGAVDGVMLSLFLHHFEEPVAVELLGEMKRVSRRFVVVNDLIRHPIPRWFLPMTRWLLGWSSISVHDGQVSVRAGFQGGELSALARAAGFGTVKERLHLPWFRISLVACR